jgi:hypothetical protein
MAKLTAGILGQVSGKVAGVVGGTWKDKNYVRAYVIPANPDSAAQQVQRGLFGRCVAWAKLLVGPVFNAYTDKFQAKMSGFNFFVKRNIVQFTAEPTFALVKVTEGKLHIPQIDSVTPDAGDSEVTIAHATDLGNNGANDDKIFAIAWNSTTDLMGFAAAETDRSAGSIVVPLAMEEDDVVHAYIWAAKYVSGVLTLISNSDYSAGVAVA